MRTLILLSLAAFSSLVIGCADVDASGPDTDDEMSTIGETDDALTTKTRYPLVSGSLDWAAGCGVRRPDGTPCYHGLVLTYEKQYRNLKVSTRTTVNNTKKTITVTVDTYSTGGPNMLGPVIEETKELGIPANLRMFTTYNAKVVDYQKNVVWTGEIRTLLAP